MCKRGTPRCRQSGSAILMAMLTVTLVATLAAGAIWQQWRAIEVESAERARVQARWILGGALDWARLILRESARQNAAVDHLSEPWAVPLQEARLSTFLAAGREDANDSGRDLPDAFLSGQITDLQSRLNVSNLVQGGNINAVAHAAFVRLFQQLKLQVGELDALTVQLQMAQKAKASTQLTQAPLMPTQFDQLLWLGLSRASLEQLRPFATLLPVPTPVNLNTAPAEVIFAVINTMEWGSAQQFVLIRNQKHLDSLADAQSRGGLAGAKLDDTQHSVNTRFFEVRAVLRTELGSTQEVSVLQRDGTVVQILSRQVSPLALAGAPTPADAAAQ